MNGVNFHVSIFRKIKRSRKITYSESYYYTTRNEKRQILQNGGKKKGFSLWENGKARMHVSAITTPHRPNVYPNLPYLKKYVEKSF